MILAMCIVFGLSLLLSLALTQKCIHWSHELQFVDHPTQGRKNHSRSTPLGGGVAVFLSFFVSLFLLLIGGLGFKEIWWDIWPTWAPYLVGAQTQVAKLISVFAGGLLILLLGLKDDRDGVMHPALKIFVLVSVALLLFGLDVRITLFLPYPLASFVLTLGWIVFLCNAFNLLDNMNGLSAGTAAVCGVNLILVALCLGQYFVALYLILFAGSLFGFLRYNMADGQIFLGDSGALFIGYNLAVAAILESFYIAGQSNTLVVAIPAFIFAVPMYDTFSVIVIRLKNKCSIFMGDQNHISHRLVRSGYTRKQAVGLVHFLALLSGGMGVYFIRLRKVSFISPMWAWALTLIGILLAEVLLKKFACRKQDYATE